MSPATIVLHKGVNAKGIQQSSGGLFLVSSIDVFWRYYALEVRIFSLPSRS
jgi:hypothetical protein